MESSLKHRGSTPRLEVSGPAGRRAAIVFEGELGVLGLAEIIQMACMGRQRFWIEILSDDERQGAIVLDGGDVVGCVAVGSGGDQAFYALAQQRRGRFVVYPADELDVSSLPATKTSWHELLMESVRLQDEAGRSPSEEPSPGEKDSERQRAKARLASWVPEAIPESGAVLIPFPRPGELVAAPPPVFETETSASGETTSARAESTTTPAIESVPSATPSSPEPSAPPPSLATIAVSQSNAPRGFDALVQQATAAYLRRDYAEALRCFEECLALRPGDRQVLHNIERLKKRGK